MKKTIVLAFLGLINLPLFGQIKGRVFDAITKEALPSVVIKDTDGQRFAITNIKGEFSLNTIQKFSKISFSSVGYQSKSIVINTSDFLNIDLELATENLQTVVVTANREAGLRTQSPLAITHLGPQLIADTKASSIFEIINKTPGVVMANLGNEQHMMGIRQPMGLSAYFLYLEDGLPIRPLGLFQNNALIEMNLMAISAIEVIKGPSASLYGAEAVGGAINFITHKPSVLPVAKLGIHLDQYGYRRLQFSGGNTYKKLGFVLSGFVGQQRNSWQSTSDFDKTALNTRIDYTFNTKTKLIGTLSYINYDSQTGGSVDSVSFFSRKYQSSTDFTYRKSVALRAKFSLEQHWSDHSLTTITPFYRNNSIKQNPFYSILWSINAKTASGQINENAFDSYGFLAQHSQKFNTGKTKWLTGFSIDKSYNPYYAYKINLAAQLRPDGRSVEKFTLLETLPNQFLIKYDAQVYNLAMYSQLDFEPLPKLNVSIGARLDRMTFDFINYLDNNATGQKQYSKITPKIGFTYDFGQDKGFYANYSQGFSPPNLTAIFRKTPAGSPQPFYYDLSPAYFSNQEIGGWASFSNKKIYFDWAIYSMTGHNELLSIRQPDNSIDYQSAGKTLHQGIEYSLTFKPNPQWFLRFGGSNSIHRFIEFTLSTKPSDPLKNVNDKAMPSAPPFVANTELSYAPIWAKNLKMSLEWQRMSAWYQNAVNTIKYDERAAFGLRGISFMNFRVNYHFKSIEIYGNIMNLSNELYASQATRGNSVTDRSFYYPAAPRSFVLGLQYNLIKPQN